MSEAPQSRKQHGRRLAPLMVFGGIGLIAILGTAVVLHGHCTTDMGDHDESVVPAREIAPGVYEPADQLDHLP